MIGQIIVTAASFNKENNIFQENNIRGVTRLGVNGTPGSKFCLNNNTQESQIILNQYGLYELDLTDLGLITSMYIKDIPENGQLYIDYIGE